MEQVEPGNRNSKVGTRLSRSVIPLGYAARQRQRRKIEEIGEALASAGYTSLDKQARVLSLPRSTAWTVLKGVHKSSGLSASTVNKMLSTNALPPEVHRKSWSTWRISSLDCTEIAGTALGRSGTRSIQPILRQL